MVQNLLASLAPNFMLVGIGTFLLLAATFLLGIASRSSQLWYDRLATRRIRRLAHYRVGDHVTLGNNIQGIVTAITTVGTVLIRPDQTQVTLGNSFVLRHPIYVHPATDAEHVTMATALLISDHPAMLTASQAAPPDETLITATREGMSPPEKASLFEPLPFDEPIVSAEEADLSQTTAPEISEPFAFSEQIVDVEGSSDRAPTLSPATNEALYSEWAEANWAQQAEEGVEKVELRLLATEAFSVHKIAPLRRRPNLGKYTVKHFRSTPHHYTSQRSTGE